MYIIYETDCQSRLNAWGRVLRAGALGWPWGMGWGGRWEGGSGWETHVHPWLIHVNVWQKPPQYCKVIRLQFKKKKGIKQEMKTSLVVQWLRIYQPTQGTRVWSLAREDSTCLGTTKSVCHNYGALEPPPTSPRRSYWSLHALRLFSRTRRATARRRLRTAAKKGALRHPSNWREPTQSNEDSVQTINK